jgi:peptidoglycan-N-acetylglucosamine deacetylase
MKLITTSWDDGHPLDFRIAELLDKYGLQGTFYIPRHNGPQKMMTEGQVQELSRHFEVGGHTLNHVWLNRASENIWQAEIEGSRTWLKDVTGTAPVSFCFPGGVYNAASLNAVFHFGYRQARTTELLSTAEPAASHLLPTSLQVYQHSNITYAKHLAKRHKWKKLLHKLFKTPATDLVTLTQYHLDKIEQEGGCFHLWGHSWEIEGLGLWKKLEDLLRVLSQRQHFTFATNKDLLPTG